MLKLAYVKNLTIARIVANWIVGIGEKGFGQVASPTAVGYPVMTLCREREAKAAMYYAILAYHAAGVVETWSGEDDAALMDDLLRINDRLVAQKSLGPAARLGPTEDAVTLRGDGLVTDGPFAETKEQLLGFYVVDFPSIDGALVAARDLQRVNPTAVYEIRPVQLYLPGAPLEAS